MKPLIHPVWAIVALPALVLLLGSDITNNLSIVHLFASGELSLYSWQSLSIGVALAAGVLGYAASRKVWYWFLLNVNYLGRSASIKLAGLLLGFLSCFPLK